jgi:hypothetical protein
MKVIEKQEDNHTIKIMELGNNTKYSISISINPIHANLATNLECESFMKIRLYNMIYNTLLLNSYDIRLWN